MNTLISVAVVLADGVESTGLGLDLSGSGMTFTVGGAFAIGDRIRVKLFDYLYPVTLAARVVRVEQTRRQGRVRLAVAFQDVSDSDRITLQHLVNNEARKRLRG